MNLKKIKTNWFLGIPLIILLFAVVFFSYNSYSPVTGAAVETKIQNVQIYSSAECSCCSSYSNYLESFGIEVKRNFVEDFSIKTQYDIPSSMYSCHTVIVEKYFVEGHVPIEIIEKLLNEQPNITGIALPGMPQGAPGMGGYRTGPLQVYAISRDGSVSLFATI